MLPLPDPRSTLLLPHLSRAQAPLTREVDVRDEFGQQRTIQIPAERPLTLFVDKREVVTLMTLGAAPELLALGYLRNQRLVESLDEVESITVDWEVEAAAVKTRRGAAPSIEARTSRRIVTTGCGQGTMFGHLMDDLDATRLPSAATAPHPPVHPAPAQRSDAQDRQRAPTCRLGARLRAVSRHRDADLC